ncbi:MAG: transcriptional repressor [Runella slithyformis]|jgi:Fur family transcriptional regulator, ferric uptake regulator|nr:MAG: transcriptional repressor [Runella slithyformis]TAG23750.1 MAG: transcriptional repressor [Cytophagales bacterium]TAG43049.1 MAG: transcriptional repressor [Cytophagia bacterium]TAF45287.1 MAG: transcriptional repressor [Runella slithyformis]TAG65335.1 MAG: transcriptional repressor [Runella slithyformis]
MENPPHLQVAMLRLNQFLELKNYRRTQERYTILEEIYRHTGHYHFDAYQLRETLENKGFHLSMATVYNTLELFEEAGLVKKHQFGEQSASHYERTVGSGQHDHVVCLDCGFIKEFCDPRIANIEKAVGEWFTTQVTQHSLVLYGHCTDKLCGRKTEKNAN